MKGKANLLFGTIVGLLLGSAITLGILAGFTDTFSSTKLIRAYPLDIAALMSHSHLNVDVPVGQTAPTLKTEAIPDHMKPGNYSLHLIVSEFVFKPESTSSKPKFGEGHGHVYIDHVLIGRAYSEWFHVPKLKSGKHTIYVTLNQNDHKEYSMAGKTIDAELQIEVK